MIEITLPSGTLMELDDLALDAAIGVIEWYRDHMKAHESYATESIDVLDKAAFELSALVAAGLGSIEANVEDDAEEVEEEEV